MNNEKIIESIRKIINNERLDLNNEELHYMYQLFTSHNCLYLATKFNNSNDFKLISQAALAANKSAVKERLNQCFPLFTALENENIPYALIKGIPLSQNAYGAHYYRFSSDIDILVIRTTWMR